MWMCVFILNSKGFDGAISQAGKGRNLVSTEILNQSCLYAKVNGCRATVWSGRVQILVRQREKKARLKMEPILLTQPWSFASTECLPNKLWISPAILDVIIVFQIRVRQKKKNPDFFHFKKENAVHCLYMRWDDNQTIPNSKNKQTNHFLFTSDQKEHCKYFHTYLSCHGKLISWQEWWKVESHLLLFPVSMCKVRVPVELINSNISFFSFY